MAQPGLPGSQFAGEDAVMRRIKDLERAVQQLAAANQLASAGIKAVEGGIVVEGSETINGPLTVNGSSKINGPLEVDGVSTFNGAMSINGPLHLQPGSIENDSLTDPLVIETSGVSQNNFPIGLGAGTFAAGTITVPAGYSKAAILCMVVGGASNSTASADYLYIASSINGVAGGETPQLVSPGGYASAAANGIRTLTGLSGGTISLGCKIRTGSGSWDAGTGTFANMNSVVYFSR